MTYQNFTVGLFWETRMMEPSVGSMVEKRGKGAGGNDGSTYPLPVPLYQREYTFANAHTAAAHYCSLI